MVYISVQPTTTYYVWQVEVMLCNFLRMGIPAESIQVLGVCSNPPVPPQWQALQARFPEVQFFYYKDLRQSSCYISSVRPNVLAQHFTKHPELSTHAVFYHDCDIVFTKPLDFTPFLQDDIWYTSDVESYIGARYVRGKGEDVYLGMCDIVGIDPKIPVENAEHTGGAQYLMKNVTAEFWRKVEVDSEALYAFFTEHLKTHPATSEYHPIQRWTADMWAVLWNAWVFGHTVRTPPELVFAWPMNVAARWEFCSLYHNAGVVSNADPRMFFKGDYMIDPPYNISNTFDPALCSYKYVEEILLAGSTT